jgi:hypothetical protein
MTSVDFVECTDLPTSDERRRATTLVAVSLAFALVQLDATIVNVARGRRTSRS